MAHLIAGGFCQRQEDITRMPLTEMQKIMQNMIQAKVRAMDTFVEQEQNPVFILATKVLSTDGKGKMELLFTPYFFSNNPNEMSKQDKRIILDWLEGYVKKEKKNLK